MTGDLREAAARDFGTVVLALAVRQLVSGAPLPALDLPALAAEACAMLDPDGGAAFAVLAAADVPDGVGGVYRAGVGAARDRALALVGAVLADPGP